MPVVTNLMPRVFRSSKNIRKSHSHIVRQAKRAATKTKWVAMGYEFDDIMKPSIELYREWVLVVAILKEYKWGFWADG